MDEEVVYILTNPCMVGLVKIGRTTVSNLQSRLKNLSGSSSIPVPFECHYAAVVKDAKFVEDRLHEAFSDRRVSVRREFFQISEHRAQAALELAALRDVTPEEDPEEAAEVKNYVNKRPPFRFSLVGIKPGTELTFAKDESITCRVINDKEIEFRGEVNSLSRVAGALLKNQFGRRSDQVQGPAWWKYNDETLEERRQRMEMELAPSSR